MTNDQPNIVPGSDDLPVPKIPWEDRRYGAIRGFWKTVFYVMRRNGRIGEDVDTYVNPKAARFFRNLVMLHVICGMFGLALCSTVAVLAGQIGDEVTRALTCLGIAAGLAGICTVGFWLASMAINWFSMPSHLDRRQMESSLYLTYYLSAPLALLAVPMVLVVLALVAMVANGDTLESLVQLRILALVNLLPLAAMIYWYQLTLSGLRSITRRSGKSMIWPGIVLGAAWALLVTFIVTLPATLVMWVLLFLTTT